MIRHFKYIILFFFLLHVNSNAQVCSYCSKKITTNYITVEGLDFHPNHFLCASCQKPIEGSFTKKDGKFFHKNCFDKNFGLKCDYCKKPIEGSFVDSEKGKFHKSCYNENIVEKCAVCNNSLIGEYVVDIHNMKYHKDHKDNLPICSNCNRIISSRTTKGGVKLEDDRSLCSLCFNSRLKTKTEYLDLLNKSIYKLSILGLKIDKKGISIEPVNKTQLNKVSDNSINSNTKGFCQSNYKFKEVNGKKEKLDQSHKIFVLDRLPEKYTESIIVHELMHVWFHQNNTKKLPSKIVEGACNYMSYVYLKGEVDTKSKEVVLLLENDPDPVYGEGFRDIKRRFESKSLNDLYKFLLNY